MKTSDLVLKFGVSDATIRRWTERFEAYLSPKAGLQRRYTEHDYQVMATIHTLSQKNYTWETIEEQLKEGKLVPVGQIPSIGYEEGKMVPAAVVDQVIDAAQLKAQLVEVTAHRDLLIEQRDFLRQNEAEYKQKVKELEQQVKALTDELKQVSYDLGYAKGRLEKDQKTD